MKKINHLQTIHIKGAREHNLQNIKVKIPKNKLVVFSGVSGSGKSSLAMDTLYAEGQRRYVESLSSYARQFLGMMRRPEVDTIEGLSPAIAIDQHGLSHNPRSTVGTSTEIYDYLRLLFARIGHPHCPKCNREVSRQTSVSITNQIIETIKKKLATQKTARYLILSPVVRDKRGEFSKLLDNLQKKGFEQVRIDGRIYNLDEEIWLIKTNRHHIDVIVDRLSLVGKKEFTEKKYYQRILDAVEISLDLSDGLATLSEFKGRAFNLPQKPTKLKDSVFSQRFACPKCNLSLSEIEPRLFSFNSPQGACPKCNGIGATLKVDRSRVSPWRADMLEAQYYKTNSDIVRQEIEKMMTRETCPKCEGNRLKKEALSVTIDQKSIAEVAAMSLQNLLEWSQKIKKSPETNLEKEISLPIFNEVIFRLNFLVAVGVEYLTLDRTASTLSVGEAQRIRLASQIGTGLTGVLYILDEPTVGLHQRDTQRLIKTLIGLRDLGNTVIVVEHDQEVLEAADYIVDFGPGAGKMGGQVVAFGTPAQIKANHKSLTGQYLSGRKKVQSHPGGVSETIWDTKTQLTPGIEWLTISGCQEHNLKNITVMFPLRTFTCLTGVSGSGKSTLIHDTLYPAVKKALDKYWKIQPGQHDKLEGTEKIDKVLLVDQSPIGRTSRSNPATYTGVYTEVRKLFSETKEAKLRGLKLGHFSFNVEGGRCPQCKGQGVIRVEMQFLPDVWVDCESCHGTRFKNEILEVEYKEKNITQVLKMTIGEALEFFSAFPKIFKKLAVLKKIGLDYLELGQASPTLSGGESQRLKLSRELVKPAKSHTLYLLDEPTTGLHYADVEKLLTVIRELVGKGNSVIVIEHNLDVIKNADWMIDLGPEGGEKGGRIIAEGTPRKIAASSNSYTGKYLKKGKYSKKA
ncbi:excinuclease ABC subunit UvrA [Patescibacteria group bacterium]